MFLPVGLLTDINHRGAEPPLRLAANMLYSGGIAVAWVFATRRRRWLPVVVAAQILLQWQFTRLFGASGPPLADVALERRLASDTEWIIFCTVAGFICLTTVVRREGTRYLRVHTEIALASEIHRQLVPPIARRIGRFEFRGISRPSSEVGGDLIDLVQSSDGWIGYVADVSGHGVAAGR